MKNIKSFSLYIKESVVSKELPASSGQKNPEHDEQIFMFSTIDEKRSLILKIVFELISTIDELKNAGEVTPQNFYCNYKPGDKEIIYNYHFYTPDESIVKKSEGKYEGHEWQLVFKVPTDIIQNLATHEVTDKMIEDAKKRIVSESQWMLLDGMDSEGLRDGNGGWQLSFIMATGEVNQWIEQQKKSRAWQPQWLKNFATWLTDKFA